MNSADRTESKCGHRLEQARSPHRSLASIHAHQPTRGWGSNPAKTRRPARTDPTIVTVETGGDDCSASRARAASSDIRRGWVSALRFDLTGASRHLVAADRKCTRGNMPRSERVEADLLNGFIDAANDDGHQALMHAMTALSRSAEPRHIYVATVLCRSAYWLLGDLRAFNEVGRVEPPSGTGRRTAPAALVDRTLEAAIELQQLRFPMAERLSICAIGLAERGARSSPLSLLPAALIAQIQYERGHLAEADAAIRAILPRIRSSGTIDAAVRSYTTLARSAAGRGRSEFALTMLREGELLGEERNWPRLTAACLLERLELLVALDRSAEAQPVSDRLLRLRPAGRRGSGASDGVAFYLELARCRTVGLNVGPRDEATLIRRLMGQVVAQGDLLVGAKLAIRLVGALDRAGERKSAQETLSKVIGIASGTGLFQTVLDGDIEVRDVLNTLQSKMPAAHLNVFVTMLLEHWPEAFRDLRITAGEKRSEGMLTPRELHVMQLISLGKSNKGIAKQLCIAPETVKSHVRNIFVRLGVSCRAEAVSRAASVGLI